MNALIEMSNGRSSHGHALVELAEMCDGLSQAERRRSPKAPGRPRDQNGLAVKRLRFRILHTAF